jgi:hypothetical protein
MESARVQVPAVGMIVAAGLDALFALILVAMSILGLSMAPEGWVTGDLSHAMVAEGLLSGGFTIAIAVAGLAIDAVIAFGALSMMRLESYGLAVAAAVLSVIPCLSSPCIVLGVPFGLWSLFVLMEPGVRDAFRVGQGR